MIYYRHYFRKKVRKESDDEMAPTPTNEYDTPVEVFLQPISGTSLPLYLTTRLIKNDDLNTKYVQGDDQEQVNGGDGGFV